MRATCVFTVASDRISDAAISVFDMPRATRPSTSSSRGVSADTSQPAVPVRPVTRSAEDAVAAASPEGAWAAGADANRSTRRRVMDGSSSASPVRTSWMAATRCSGVTSLSRKPLAPAVSAAYTYLSRSNVVKMMIRGRASMSGGCDGVTSAGARGDGHAATIWRVASMPSTRGIRMSISTTSGWCPSTAATACSPSAASATTSMPAAFRISRNPRRTRVWSSAITTVIVGAPSVFPPVTGCSAPGRA